VEDLIEISRFDAGSAQLIAEDTDVSAAVQECLRARNWADGVPGGAGRADGAAGTARRFDVIVANLVGQTRLRATAPRRFTVRASIQAGRGGRESELVLEVRDHGPGLPRRCHGARVRPVSTRADSVPGRASEGSGLGLAIAQENARLHGGADRRPPMTQVAARVFTVRLPVH